jgi:hypothetical protein
MTVKAALAYGKDFYLCRQARGYEQLNPGLEGGITIRGGSSQQHPHRPVRIRSSGLAAA